MIMYRFQLDTEHFQFYREDLVIDHDTSLLWSNQADQQLDSLDGLLAIATARWGLDTAVSIQLRQLAPNIIDENGQDHTSAASIGTISGSLHLTTPQGETSQAPFIPITPGAYSVRVYYINLNSVLDELAPHGQDCYKLVLWPQS